ncbi:MAG: hydroxymethylbilane synthase [Candidatus Bathyarchaeia archaeon]
MRNAIIVGTRGSALALAQTKQIIQALKELESNLRFEITEIKTKGDNMRDSGESALDSKRLFTKEIEESLIDKEIRIAVHSMKDLTTELPIGLKIGAVPQRADHRDALISRDKRKFEQLSGGARVGTSSPRRRTQLLAARNDLHILTMHGNVDTRLRKLEAGEYDAIIVAAAGLARLGMEKRATELLSTRIMLPAVGQGALAVEIREDDEEMVGLLSRINHEPTHRAVEAERAFARKLGANCKTPIAAFAIVHETKLRIDGMVASSDGRMLLRTQLISDKSDPKKVGEELAESLINKGAQLVLEAA